MGSKNQKPEYHADTGNDTNIKILYIRKKGPGCRVVHSDFEPPRQPPMLPYEALSYSWSSEEPNVAIDQYNSGTSSSDDVDKLRTARVAMLQQRLVEALDAASSQEDLSLPSLWIDAICIDQEDRHQRIREAMKMGEIYFVANDAVIWLSDDRAQDVASDSIPSLFAIVHDPHNPCGKTPTSDLRRRLEDIARLKYGTRTLGVETKPEQPFRGMGHFMDLADGRYIRGYPSSALVPLVSGLSMAVAYQLLNVQMKLRESSPAFAWMTLFLSRSASLKAPEEAIFATFALASLFLSWSALSWARDTEITARSRLGTLGLGTLLMFPWIFCQVNAEEMVLIVLPSCFGVAVSFGSFVSKRRRTMTRSCLAGDHDYQNEKLEL